MINRELIRIKVVQLVYAYYMNGGKSMDIAEKELLTSLSKAYHLYNHLLDLIVAITREERMRYEIQCQRAEREGQDMPSSRFVYNRFAVQLEENEQLAAFKDAQKLNWREDVEFIRRMCNLIEQTDTYKEYMAAEKDSYEEDREVWRKLYKQVLSNNDDLDQLLEERSLYWNDDKEIVDSFVLKTIKRFEAKNGAQQELLPEYKDSDDRDYALKLFRSTINNAEEYQNLLTSFSKNWQIDRMPFTDIVIMQIALAEIMTFPVIPVSVSINEYVELSKAYSTPRSAGYINGMLDTIARSLINDGKLLKTIK